MNGYSSSTVKISPSLQIELWAEHQFDPNSFVPMLGWDASLFIHRRILSLYPSLRHAQSAH